jgi:hypothetical protein
MVFSSLWTRICAACEITHASSNQPHPEMVSTSWRERRQAIGGGRKAGFDKVGGHRPI